MISILFWNKFPAIDRKRDTRKNETFTTITSIIPAGALKSKKKRSEANKKGRNINSNHAYMMLFCCHCNNCYSGNSRTNAARFAYITQHWLADTSDGQTFAYPSIGHNNNESKILLWCVASGVIGLGFGIFFVLSRNSSPRKCIIKSFTSLRGTRRSKSYIVEYRKTIIRVQKICIHTLRELHPRCAMCEVMFYSGHFTARPAPTTTTRPLCEGRRLTFHSPHHSQHSLSCAGGESI